MKRPVSTDELPDSLPVFPLGGALLLPFAQRPLNIFEPRYIAMVDAALAGDRLIGLIQPENTDEESPRGRVPLQRVGCIGRITHFDEMDEDRYFIILDGLVRFSPLAERETDQPFRTFEIDATPFAGDFERGLGADAVDRDRFVKMMRDYADYAKLDLDWQEIERTPTADLVNFCCMVSPYGAAEKQVLLEAETLLQRAETLIAMAELEMARAGPGMPLQ